MERTPFRAILIIVVLLAVLGSMTFAAQDRFTVKVPNGLAFSEFRGYETWQNVAVSQTENGLKVIAANDAMINAYRQGVPGAGKSFRRGGSPTQGPETNVLRGGRICAMIRPFPRLVSPAGMICARVPDNPGEGTRRFRR